MRNKLVCGYCGKSIQGDSGTSKTGKIIYYYKCMERKRTHGCNKKINRKDALEDLVVNSTLRLLSKPETVSFIAEQVIRQHKEKAESDSLMKILSDQKADASKALNNILKAIEAGIINETTRKRMEELEKTIADLNEKILLEKAKADNFLTKEEICDFFLKTIKKNPQAMIRILIKQVVVYDDKIEIFYYFTSKNPDDNGRDFTLIGSSDSSPMVEHVKPKTNFIANRFSLKQYYFSSSVKSVISRNFSSSNFLSGSCKV